MPALTSSLRHHHRHHHRPQHLRGWRLLESTPAELSSFGTREAEPEDFVDPVRPPAGEAARGLLELDMDTRPLSLASWMLSYSHPMPVFSGAAVSSEWGLCHSVWDMASSKLSPVFATRLSLTDRRTAGFQRFRRVHHTPGVMVCQVSANPDH